MTGAEIPKRQHYVPRLILRGFSPDGRRISLRVLASGQFVPSASLNEQCYENYFYGADGGLEGAFGKMEEAFKSAVGDLSPGHLERITVEERHLLCLFVHYQRVRTVAAADETADFVDGLAKRILAKDPSVNAEMLARVKIGPEKPQYETLFHAAEAEPLLLDLDVKFLVSDKKLGFVLSDNPVAGFNQWMEHHPVFRGVGANDGVALRGLQWFLPLSPNVCVAVFDPGAYDYGSPRRRTCSVGMRDIRLLNTLQALRARECIYFDPRRTAEEEIFKLCHDRHNYAVPSVRFNESEIRELPDGNRSQLIFATLPSPQLGTQLGCVRVKKDARVHRSGRVPFPVRSPDLVDLMERWSGVLKKMKGQEKARTPGNGSDESGR